ncbi:hypothetical protein FNV43_RR05498 [Rhamnella rubrinervis]|uniref:LOB domain-containing protein n=1 Tax=Rhamnella rubrinervis TaxID=2594499 RepID=A0A8K0HM95_9ROSA|nr:hypothetical protein FNV43_RR05498 [Rhamnella rubrinervis]
MEYCTSTSTETKYTTTTSSPNSSSSSPPPPPSNSSCNSSSPPPPNVVMSPCAACKILRRRCADKCVLAPYFPPTEPVKFTIAHRVFGASNIIKFLQELPESQRADAVSSMVYEAGARIRDPVYGCAGAICQLQKQVSELQAQLAKAQAELVTMQCQQTNLVSLIMEMAAQSQHDYLPQQFNSLDSSPPHTNSYTNQLGFHEDNNNLGSSWEVPLWT